MQRFIIISLLVAFLTNLSNAQLKSDVQMVSFTDQAGYNVSIYIPSIFTDDRNQVKLIGKRLFGKNTLYYQKRRIEVYEHVIREIVQMPITSEYALGFFKSMIKNLKVTSEQERLLIDIIEHSARGINKKYVSGASLTNRLKNHLSNIGRKANAVRRNSSFATVCFLLADLEATLALGDIVIGGLLQSALATDAALNRIQLLKHEIEQMQKEGVKVDISLITAIKRTETNLIIAREKWKAFIVSINDHRDDLVKGSLSLASALLSVKIGHPAFWAFGAQYKTIAGILDQETLAQAACCSATLHMLLEERKKANLSFLSAYAAYSYYDHVYRCLDINVAKLRNLFHTDDKEIMYYYLNKVEEHKRAIIALVDSSILFPMKDNLEGKANAGHRRKPTTNLKSSQIGRKYTRSIYVSSTQGWQDTGLDINAGDLITITASGTIQYASDGSTSTPDGLSAFAMPNADGTCHYLLCEASIPTHSLVGRIGSPDLTDFTNGFFVGSSYTATAAQTGDLLLGFNDGFVRTDRSGLDRGGVGDNSGSFRVTISVLRTAR